MKNFLILSSVVFSVLFLPNMSNYNLNHSIGLFKKGNPETMKYQSPKDKFEISFDCIPEIIEEPVSNPMYGDYILARYICEGSNSGTIVSVSRYPKSFTKTNDEKETVRGCIVGYESGFGISIKSSTISIDGKDGKLAKFETNGMYWVIGVVFKEQKLFQIGLLGIEAYPSESEINQFIGSFKTI